MFKSIALALTAGAMLPLQALINARLGRAFGSPLWAAALSGACTAVLLTGFAYLTLRAGPRVEQATALPWWAWTGGLCGAFALAGMAATAPRLGAGTMTAMVVAGQVLFALILDQIDPFGVAAHPVTLQRVVAAGLLLAGAMLLR